MTVQPGTVQPGTLTLRIDDRTVSVEVMGGGSYELPIGPVTLVEGALGESDPPSPVDLTNALGLVADHVDDLVIESPSVAAAPTVRAVGHHALAMARVEIGDHEVPDGYLLRRADADEVFRTLALEDAHDRRSNPGLDESHVESIIGTCCVILGVMRRLDLRELHIASAERTTG